MNPTEGAEDLEGGKETPVVEDDKQPTEAEATASKLHKRFICTRLKNSDKTKASWKTEFELRGKAPVTPTKVVAAYWPNAHAHVKQHAATFLAANFVLNNIDEELKHFHANVSTADWEDTACRIVITNSQGAALLSEVVNKNAGGTMAMQMAPVILSLPFHPDAEVTVVHKGGLKKDLYDREDVVLWTYIPTKNPAALAEQVTELTTHYFASIVDMDPLYTNIVSIRPRSFTAQRQTLTKQSHLCFETEGDAHRMLPYLGHFIATRLCNESDHVLDITPTIEPELFPSLSLDIDERPPSIRNDVVLGSDRSGTTPWSVGHSGWLGVCFVLHPARRAGIYMAIESGHTRGDASDGPENRFCVLRQMMDILQVVETSMEPFAGWTVHDYARHQTPDRTFGYDFSRTMIEMIFSAAEDMDARRNDEDSLVTMDTIKACLRYQCEWKLEKRGQQKKGQETLTLYKNFSNTFMNANLETKTKRGQVGLWLKVGKKTITTGTRIVAFAGRWMTMPSWWAVRYSKKGDDIIVDGETLDNYRDGHHIIEEANKNLHWPSRWRTNLAYVTYPTQANKLRYSKLKHNCKADFQHPDPTVDYGGNGPNLPYVWVLATADIKAGEELLINYEFKH